MNAELNKVEKNIYHFEAIRALCEVGIMCSILFTQTKIQFLAHLLVLTSQYQTPLKSAE